MTAHDRSVTGAIAFLVFVLMGCIWNGASFYIEVFAERYRLKFVSDGDMTAASADDSSTSSAFFDPDELPEEEESAATSKNKGE